MKIFTPHCQLILALVLFIGTQVAAQTEQKRQLSAFKGIEVGSAIELIINQGNTQEVVVNTAADLQSEVITEVSGEILKLHLDTKDWENWRNKKVVITVTIPTLTSLRASGASRVTSNAIFKTSQFKLSGSGASKVNFGLNTDQLEVDLSGASVLDLHLMAKSFTAELSGASKATISGNAEQQDLELNGASKYEAYKLESKRASIDASSASHANISVSEELNAVLSSASHLNYKGSPKTNQLKSSGAASIHKTE